MTTNDRTFADELRDAVSEHGITIYRLSKLTGINRATLGTWLKDRHVSTSSKNLHAIAIAIGKEITLTNPQEV